MYKNYIKRILDVLLSGIGIVVLSPVMAVVAVIVRIKIGSPVLFTQERPGLHEKIFKLYKFRTMNNKKDRDGNLLPDEQRLEKTGKVLRSTSLDELPELFNILKGDMSIVGPRPLLVRYLDRYSKRQKHRHDVRPGLTGLAQVNGRNAISWEEKFEYDLKYIKHITFMNDLWIVIKTVASVLSREGISSETSATMEEFMGTKKKRSGV
ncbi:MAG: sugar transferase [Lachnospiraceae bacterium]|nr:sugar transferase [Lachnospiraceae bacterium]